MALTFRDPEDYEFVRRQFVQDKDNTSQDEAIDQYSPKGISAVNDALEKYLTIPIASPTETQYGAMCAKVLQYLYSEKGDMQGSDSGAVYWANEFDRLIAIAIEEAQAEQTEKTEPPRIATGSFTSKIISEEPTDGSYEF